MNDTDWTNADDANLAHWGLPEGHPSKVVKRFYDLVWNEPADVEALRGLVTPESNAQWGEFEGAREFLQDLAISNRTLRLREAADVMFVKVVENDQARIVEKPEPAFAYVVLVWRPSLGGWRIHRIGDPVPAYELPRENASADLRHGRIHFARDVVISNALWAGHRAAV